MDELNQHVMISKGYNSIKQAGFRCIHPPLHPKWFPVNGIMSKEGRPVPFSAFVRLWMGPFSLCPPQWRVWVCLYVGRQSGTLHVRSARCVSIFLSVPVILHVQLVLSPDLWPFLSQVPEQSEEGRRGRQKVREREKDRHRQAERKINRKRDRKRDRKKYRKRQKIKRAKD